MLAMAVVGHRQPVVSGAGDGYLGDFGGICRWFYAPIFFAEKIGEIILPRTGPFSASSNTMSRVFRAGKTELSAND